MSHPMKFLKFFGTVFMIIGLVVTLSMIFGGILSHDYPLVLFALCWGAIFIGIGALFRITGGSNEKRVNKILDNGTSYTGIIYRYVNDTSMMINGSYPICVVVRYMADGMVREAIVPTMETSAQNYPLGYAATIKLYDGKAAFVPGTIELKTIPDQDLLTESSILQIQTNPHIRKTCPYCGAPVNIALGGYATCDYCNSRIHVDENGNVV